MTHSERRIHVGVLALQGAFHEHIQLLKSAFEALSLTGGGTIQWSCSQIRTPEALADCDALIIPGGESTTMALVAQRSSLLEPLRRFVKVERKPTWGTCAGLILLAESANRTKKGGQDLIGGLDVRVNRNHFGRQNESFEIEVNLPFLENSKTQRDQKCSTSFNGVFIRAPVVERLLTPVEGVQVEEEQRSDTIVAPSQPVTNTAAARSSIGSPVEVLASLSVSKDKMTDRTTPSTVDDGDIIAVRQGSVFGTSFHPELAGDPRIHLWWLNQVQEIVLQAMA